ncbi:IS1634 family transposase [Metamycoplasma equirhinis]|uniref:IS1634 family transposase n=1 Tax=Metamycoplasma equirhinis TaxID=92402 RepID=UPI003593E299
MNNEKIEEDSKYDGYYVYETSRIDLKASEIVDIYKKQWQIEENFRTLKGCLELRPVFVYTDNHIKGHFILCFLAFVVIKFILNVINKNLKENGVIDENITNTKFIKTIESAIYIEKYSNNTLIEKIYINNDENKLNLENYEIYKKILKMLFFN